MKTSTSIASFALGCVLILWLLAVFSPSAPAPRSERTKLLIERCYQGQLMIEQKSENGLAGLLGTESKGTELNAKFAATIDGIDGLDLLGATVKTSNSLTTLVDGWERPLRVAWRADVLRLNATARVLARTNELLIWSSGKNGIDEFGSGDDIF